MTVIPFPGTQGPFLRAAKVYANKGYLPFPVKKNKAPAISGVTGNNPYPAGKTERRQLVTELLENARPDSGIGIWLPDDIVGIDVDQYADKNGAAQLADIESDIGELPATYISTARNPDTGSGIRFYRLPAEHRGHKLRASAPLPDGTGADSIDIIQHNHRYAVVWPSAHPAGGTYTWYRQDDGGALLPLDTPPARRELPLLPRAWARLLDTGKPLPDRGSGGAGGAGGTGAGGSGGTGASDDTDAHQWVTRHCYRDVEDTDRDAGMCHTLRKCLDGHLRKLGGAAHDPLTAAHHNLLLSGAEGHRGARAAIEQYEAAFLADLEEQRPERYAELVSSGEMRRSFLGAARLVKERYGDGQPIDCSCHVSGADGGVRLTDADYASILADARIEEKRLTKHFGIEGRPPRLPFDKYPFDEAGEMQRLIEYAKGRLCVFPTGEGFQFGLYSTIDHTWHYSPSINELATASRSFWGRETAARLDKLRQRAAACPDGSSEKAKAEGAAKRIAAGLKYINTRSTSSRNRNVMSMMRDDEGLTVEQASMEPDPLAIPVGDGRLVCFNPDGTFTVRRRTADDLILHATSACWRGGSGGSGSGGSDGAGVGAGGSGSGGSGSGLTFWLGNTPGAVWVREMMEAIIPDSDYREYVVRALGHTLIGNSDSLKVLFLVGGTGRGKSTLREALAVAAGQMLTGQSGNGMLSSKMGKFNELLMSSMQRRVVTIEEVGAQSLSREKLKQIAGGNPFTLSVKNSNRTVSGVPRFNLVFVTNDAPSIPGMGAAEKRRLLVLPIGDHRDEPMAPAPGQPTFKDVLRGAEKGEDEFSRQVRDALLSMFLWGLSEYLRNGREHGLVAPESSRETLAKADADFAAEASDINAFIQECLRPARGAEEMDAKKGELVVEEWASLDKAYQTYRMFMEQQGQEKFTVRKARFKADLRSNGVKVERRMDRRGDRTMAVWLLVERQCGLW